MSQSLRGRKVFINGQETWIVPTGIPSSPTNGQIFIDSSDGKLKVYNEGKSRWIILGDAEDQVFDNSSNNFTSDNVQDAIEESKNFRIQTPQFQFIGQMNYSQYLYSNSHSANLFTRRSGNESNGYRYGNSAPINALYSGTVVSATASITGIAQSTGSAASSVELKFELWKVGFNSEGTKLGDIIFNINSGSYTIGTYWNSSILTSFVENQSQNISISAGDLLGLKFIRQTGNDKVVAVTNTTIVLEIEGNL